MTKPDFKGFAEELMNDRFEGGIDGFDLQELGLKYGLLEEKTMIKPCGENCACNEAGVGFPTACYRKTYI